MADAGFFKGTSAEQDRRFSDKELKLLKSMKFPPEFDKKVDMRKVNLSVIRPWVAKKIVELVGMEDEVVIEYAMGLLEDESQPVPDPRKMQINLTGFLTKETPAFMSALWKLLIEAQEDVTGIPRTMLEEKKEEMRKARQNDTRAIDERDRRARLDEVRGDGERGRGGGSGRSRGRGRGRGRGYDDDRRPRDSGWGGRGGGPGGGGGRGRRVSRSPPRRDRSASMASSRGSRSPPRRYRSPPRRGPSRVSRSPSRTPPGRRRPSPVAGSLSRSPSPARPSRSRSRTPVFRRRRSPLSSPPPHERDRNFKPRRDSRSPPPRRRRGSPNTRRHGSPLSRSRSPPPRGYHPRRRSASPPSRKRSPALRGGRKRSPSGSVRSRSPSPRRRSPDDKKRPSHAKRRYDSRSRSRTPVARDDRMDIDERGTAVGSGELKIRGQAEAERRKSKWDEAQSSGGGMQTDESQADLEKRENELKERALRNKVMRTRKGT